MLHKRSLAILNRHAGAWVLLLCLRFMNVHIGSVSTQVHIRCTQAACRARVLVQHLFSRITYIVKIAAANQSDAFVSLRIRGFLLAVPWWNGHVN